MFYRNIFSLIFILALAALVLPGRAQAYLDAGTGSYLIQLAVAFIAGGLFMAKTFWRRLWLIARRSKKFQNKAAPLAEEKPQTRQDDQP